MIKASFIYDDKQLRGFSVSGHSGYAQSGSDIVCASVSSACYMAANTVTDVIRDEAAVSEDNGWMSLSVASPDDRTVAVLEGLRVHLEALCSQYPRYIKVIYVNHNNGGKNNA